MAIKSKISLQTIALLIDFVRNINFFSHRRLKKSDVLFFSSDANKSERVVGGQQFDRYLDTLSLLAKSKGLLTQSIAWPGSFYHGRKTWGKALNITWPYLVALARDVLNSETESKKHRLSFFVSILERVNPRVIFTIGEFDGLIRSAARRLEIPCVEVLHASGYHTSPDGWFAGLALPSHVLAFDEVSKELLVEYCGRDSEVILTEDYWTNSWHKDIRDETKAGGISLPQFEFAPILTSAPNRILVSLQWGYGGDSTRYVGESRGKIFENGLFPSKLLEAIEALGESAFWHFRLHPVQLNSGRGLYKKQRKYLNRLFAGVHNVDVRRASHAPLPSLLAECTHNITTSSSLCYEAAEFGIPTLTTSPLLLSGESLQFRFRDLSREGYVLKVDPNFPGIVDWVRETGPMLPRHRSELGRSIHDILDDLTGNI